MATVTESPPAHQPYVPDDATMPEFTLVPIIVGALLGIVFGASSIYLVLKVGMTVSASIPVAVLSITLFRVMLVSVLGGLLGIFMMIPLRRAFIVKLHGKPGEPGKLLYPECTACAQVLISGEK